MIFLIRLNLLMFLLLQAEITITEGRRRSRRGFVLSREDLEHYTSDPSIEDYDFTTPVYIEPESMVSKRSVDSKPVTSMERDVKFNAFGQTYHVRLQPNYWLLRPGLVVERVGADGTVTEEDIQSRDCYYYTHLISHSGESAGALSTCDGLRGMISHDDNDIYISPLKDHHASRYRRETEDELEQPHLVYKRSSRRGQRTSETTSSATSSFDYDHDDEDTNDADSDHDEEIYYSYDETRDFDGNNTYNNNQTFCDEIYRYTDDLDPSPQRSHSWNQDSLEGGNVSHSEPIFADMAAGQEEGEHLQEWGHRYIEMFLVLDDKMNKFHKEDLMNYSLALMNMVSRRYAEPSLLAEVRLALVKIVVAEVQELTMTGLDGVNYTLNIQADGYLLVRELCAWQHHFNPASDDDPLHYDGTTLLTRKNLYKMVGTRQDKGLLGRATIGSICQRQDSCNVNEEDGLEAALTITHELGHNLNLHHDPDYGCNNGVNIMSSMKTTGPSSFKWSRCSSSFFADFLESPRSSCLLDEPSTDHPGVQLLPVDVLAGAQYTRLEQCKKAFGNHINKLCDGARTYVTCGQISCKQYGHCIQTTAMEGTSCGENMWCYAGFCRSSIGGIPGPIDGGWGPWQGNYSECSRSCGTGVIYKKRPCNNPAPRFGGKACDGPMYIMETCNPNPCPGVNISDKFRHHQCALTNPILYQYRQHKWSADMDGSLMGDRLCDLRCVSNKGASAVRPPKKVTAGTRCWDEEEPDELRRTRRCIDKRCKEFGCDGVYGSGKLLDGCDKCEGSGRTCTLVKGTLRNRIGTTAEYVPWITVPVGATMVNITNTKLWNQCMAMSIDGVDVWRAQANSLSRIDPERFIVGNTHILLKGVRREYEQIWVLSGPTTKELQIDIKQDLWPYPYVSLKNFRKNPTLFYEWYEPISDPVSYYWEVYPITGCSKTCGGGSQTLNATCIEEINGEKVNISDRFCEETTVKPISSECNTEVCPYGPGYMWLPDEWGECSVTCGDGIKRRNTRCIVGSTMAPRAAEYCIMYATWVSRQTTCSNPACPTLGTTSPAPNDTAIANEITLTMTSSEVGATMDGDVTIEVTTSNDLAALPSPSQLPPLIAIPPRNGCTSTGHSTVVVVVVVVVGLVLMARVIQF